MKRSVQSAHFKAFRVEQKSSETVLQTVLPKRILKKAVDRNGLRRIIRESARACELSGIRVVLLQGRGFKECPSRKALKTEWRQEVDGLLLKLKRQSSTASDKTRPVSEPSGAGMPSGAVSGGDS